MNSENYTSAVEVTTQYSTTVDDLKGAWLFVMDKVEMVGPDPAITITPLYRMVFDEDEDASLAPRQFSVVVSGMVEEDK